MDSPLAIVVAHPAHLLAVAGVLLRWRPRALVVFRAVAGGGLGQERVVRSALDALGVADLVTELGVSETESFARALAGDVSFHRALGKRVTDWLKQQRPRTVLADAYEAYNFHHDLARLFVDVAVRELPGTANCEFPLSFRPDVPHAPVRYGSFLAEPGRAVCLSDAEVRAKELVLSAAARTDPFVANVIPMFADRATERYRTVPAARDYTAPPPGYARFYDERGLELQAAGRVPRAVTFEEHFVPLVRALVPVRAAAA